MNLQFGTASEFWFHEEKPDRGLSWCRFSDHRINLLWYLNWPTTHGLPHKDSKAQHLRFPWIILKDFTLLISIPTDSEPEEPISFYLIYHNSSTFLSHFRYVKSGSILQFVASFHCGRQGAVATQLSASASAEHRYLWLLWLLSWHCWTVCVEFNFHFKISSKLHMPYL